jgi:predicted TIM-barrel fold metal-dependent hydrolase
MEQLGDRYEELAQEVEFSEEESLSILRSAYPDAASFAVISIDLEYSGVPVGPQGYREQLEELARLGDLYGPVVLPFFALDPRRDNALELARHYIQERGFVGLALYPPLGFMPFDRRLMPAYEYAAQHRLPVIAQCSPESIRLPEPPPTDFDSLVSSGVVELPGDGSWTPELARVVVPSHFGHPVHYRYVVSRFPNLKLCLSHGGGRQEWQAHPASTVHWAMRNWSSLVLSMLRTHPGIYTDVASVVGERAKDRLKDCLGDPGVRDKVLYGSDYHTVNLEGTEREFLIEAVRALGPEEFRRIAFANPRRFLSSDLHPLDEAVE